MKNDKESRNSLLKIKIPLYLILTFSAVAIYGLNYTINYFKKEEPKPLNPTEAKGTNPLNIVRETDYKLTKPILLADTKNDDKKYDGIKRQIKDYIDGLIKNATISTASVYYCELNDGSQFNINPDERYRPTDMLEITKMIALLKQSEKEKLPALLDKKITYIKKINPSYRDFQHTDGTCHQSGCAKAPASPAAGLTGRDSRTDLLPTLRPPPEVWLLTTLIKQVSS